ncbi:MAG: type II methionyl aminopeptidase [Nanoarchaeota archaeon]|jgi:methionyl aminopeptidase|nr:type II methionyl aminopeptidase [Nanoarchaeota archaeon]
MNKESIIKAGSICSEVKKWIRPQIKKGDLLLDIADKIEDKIKELGGLPAFPTNLSINEQAAHYTPTWNDESTAHGLIKVDFGIHVDGWIADNAFSLDLEGTNENEKLIEASQKALEAVEKNINSELTIGELGKIIEDTINSYGFNPIANLSGHSMEQYNLHAGVSVSNMNNHSTKKFGTGLYASEPFVTNGNGIVHDGAKGNIYAFVQDKQPRNPNARKILEFIKDEFGDLPFASRWIVKKFGNKSRISLMQLEREGILHHYAILTEAKGKLVSQTENTFLVSPEEVMITTK